MSETLALRLITPTDPERQLDALGDPGAVASSGRCYQLTHDYLVPSLRRWLRQEEEATYAGRARLRLAGRTAMWVNEPDVQQLPKWWEYFNILAFTRSRDWSQPQQRMMTEAGRYYATRLAALAAIVLALAWGSREAFSRFKASELVASLIKASPDNLVQAVADVQRYLPWAKPELQRLAGIDTRTEDQRRQQLHARLALLGADPTQVPPLVDSLLEATPPYVDG